MQTNTLKILLVSFACLLFMAPVTGQEYYSYMTDRRFFDPTDLIGYAFNPDLLEIPDKDVSRPLRPGTYSFGIALNNLYVFGDQIKGLYNVNQINTTDYGFQLVLLDTWDPGKKGHLKIIQTPSGLVEALIFRRSQLEPEMIFFLPLLPEDLDEREASWFTDVGEAFVAHPDSLYGMVFRPFLRIQNDPRLQQRFQVRDSTEIRFIQEIEVTEKLKKRKQIDTVTTDTSGYEVKRKITKRHFVEVRTLVNDDISGRKELLWREEINNLTEKVDEQASGIEEKYMITIQTDKGNEYALFLTASRTFSSFDFGGEVFYARGR